MSKKHALIALLSLLLCVGGCVGRINTQNLVKASANLYQSASITDAQLISMSVQLRNKEDRQYQVAPPNSPYTKRLNKLMARLQSVNGIPLTYKVYMTKAINANAAANGSVRVFSGLMDIMTDDELRFVIGHEIGHVANGHVKKRLRTAYLTAAARSAAGIYSPAGTITNSALGSIAEAFINSQYSQSQELEADAYGLKFLRDNGYNLQAAVSCMGKLKGSGGFFSTHPSSKERIQKLQKQINEFSSKKHF
ncbi:MAG: M48 family metalloprotease [Desulfovibrionaceae bacterium]|nr:M48 family metalloprotease [Desulfovibrionaceae bacterium]